MDVDWLIKLWDKGGVALVMIVLMFLLLWFVGRRGVKAIDRVSESQTASMSTIANAVTTSSAANVVALGALTERVSRIEGKVDTIGAIAIKEATAHPPPHMTSRQVNMASVVEVFDEDGYTPIGGIPTEPQAVPIVKRPNPTPAKGTYSIVGRAPTKSGKP